MTLFDLLEVAYRHFLNRIERSDSLFDLIPLMGDVTSATSLAIIDFPLYTL